MIDRTTPTEEGKRLYPDEPAGHYCANEMPGPACTCVPECPQPCKGGCGCEACNEAYGDYLSCE